ncbi:hypothetical protein [Duganella aceris]|uniref:MFS transporter n=1 Tax=Duganella aceris TaxID=2703883 RepID=A0ABX0FV57_9BURK|nr:hypothetical protein [Duganella aceris]NGZ88260.1 hypothetical protein [Duganella aceris]
MNTLRSFRARPAKTHREAGDHWLKKYAKENPLKLAWLSLLSWGTLSLFSYFQYIDYFPNFDLQAAVNVLLSLAYIAIIVSTIIATAMLFPSLGILLAQRAAVPVAKPGRFGGQLVEWTAYNFLSLCILTLLILVYSYLDWSFAYAAIAYGFSIILLFSVRAKRIPRKFLPNPVPDTHTTRPHHLDKWQKLLRRHLMTRLGAYLFIGCLQTVPCSLLLLTLDRASSFKPDDYSGMMLGIVQYAMLLAAAGTLVLYIAKKNRKYWYAVFPLALLLPLIATMFLHATGMLPMMVAQRTKIGNFYAERLTISGKSCSSVATFLAKECEKEQVTPVHLCNVHVMSRIGSETYIRLSAATAGKNGQHATIPLLLPSADISTVQIDFKKKIFSLELIDANLAKASSVCPSS